MKTIYKPNGKVGDFSLTKTYRLEDIQPILKKWVKQFTVQAAKPQNTALGLVTCLMAVRTIAATVLTILDS